MGSKPGVAQYDGISLAAIVIDHSHHHLHSSEHFYAFHEDTAMDTAATLLVLIVTPNTTNWGHFTLVAEATGAATVEVFEAVTTQAPNNDGTALTEFNRNRNSVVTAGLVATHTPSINAAGTRMGVEYVGGAPFKGTLSGGARGENELMLKQNTKYLLKLTANADGIKASIGADWYEHISL